MARGGPLTRPCVFPLPLPSLPPTYNQAKKAPAAKKAAKSPKVRMWRGFHLDRESSFSAWCHLISHCYPLPPLYLLPTQAKKAAPAAAAPVEAAAAAPAPTPKKKAAKKVRACVCLG